MSLLCRRHHLPVYPPVSLLALSLSCHSALHFDNGNAPSGYALNFWLALPYPNWLTTHKQTSPSPRSHAHLSLSLCLLMLLPTLEGSSCCDYRAISLAGNDNSLVIPVPAAPPASLAAAPYPPCCLLPAARVVAFDVTC